MPDELFEDSTRVVVVTVVSPLDVVLLDTELLDTEALDTEVLATEDHNEMVHTC